jgi:hypothetical protein
MKDNSRVLLFLELLSSLSLVLRRLFRQDKKIKRATSYNIINK